MIFQGSVTYVHVWYDNVIHCYILIALYALIIICITDDKDCQKSTIENEIQHCAHQNRDDENVKIEMHEIDLDYDNMDRPLILHDSTVQSFCRYSCLSFLMLAVFCFSIIGLHFLIKEQQSSNPVQETRSQLAQLQNSNFNASSWFQVISHYSELSLLGNHVVPVIVKLTNFTKKLKNKEEWNSSCFLAFHGHGGYKMYLRVYAAGCDDGEDHYISLYLYFLKSSYDDQLAQSIAQDGPLKGMFTIELLNQQNSSNHHVQHFPVYDDETIPAVNESYVVCKATQFISHDTILSDSSNGYFKNDSLFFRIDFEFERHPLNFYSHTLLKMGCA